MATSAEDMEKDIVVASAADMEKDIVAASAADMAKDIVPPTNGGPRRIPPPVPAVA